MNKNQLLQFIKDHKNSDMIVFKDSYDIKRLKDIMKQLVESENWHLPIGESTKKNKKIKDNQKSEDILALFIAFGKKHNFKIKIEKNHDYSTFNKERIIDHILWWYLRKAKNIPNKDLNKLWKTKQKNKELQKLLNDDIIQKGLDKIFYD